MEHKQSNSQASCEKSTKVSDNLTGLADDSDKQRPILVLINPHSGRGKSIQIYKKKLVPFLNSHDIEYETFITDNDLRVDDFIRSKALSELINYRSILVVSGDGLLHEALNAIMGRQDWEKAINVPIGLIPTGSGNGMAYTLIRQRHPNLKHNDDAIKVCLEQAIRRKTCQADLVKVTCVHNSRAPTTIWSFLSIGWGLMADIDIDSEWLRKLGELRFTIYGVLRSATAKSRKGRLSFKMAEMHQEQSEKLKHESNSTMEMWTNSESYRNDDNDDSDEPTGKGGWIHIEDKFACVYAVYQSYISRLMKFAPDSTLTDELIYLTYVRGKLTTCQAIEFLLAIDDGSHDKLPFVTCVPVTSFIFQPQERSKIVVDGEVISWEVHDGPVKAEVVPKIMKLCWDDCFECQL